MTSARRDFRSSIERFKAHPPSRRVLLASNPGPNISAADILSFSDHSFSLRFSDIGGMVHWAELAATLADSLCRKNSSPNYHDLRAVAWSQKANCFRMIAHFAASEASFEVAEVALGLGTGTTHLAARLWELRGSLYRDWRRFDLAQASVGRARALYEIIPDETGQIRCLIIEAMCAGKARNPVRAVHLAEKAMDRVDPSVDPLLAICISHTLAFNLVAQGRPRQARAVYVVTEPLYDEVRAENLLQTLRFWLVAKIDEALGLVESAELLLRRTCAAYSSAGLVYEEALARLDLALILARQHRMPEVLEALDAIQPLFEALGIGPEAAVAQRLRIEAIPSNIRQVVRSLRLASREILLHPLPPQPIPAIAA